MKSRPSDQYASCPQLQKKGAEIAKAPPSETELALRHFTTKYDSYRGLLQASRRRLSDGGGGGPEDSPGGTPHHEEDSGADESCADDAAASGRVTEQERLQIESFFRGLKTNVFVCRSLANLYVGRRASAIHNGAAEGPEEWDLHYTGIPVVILDVGETRSRSKRRITMLLAERGSCFALWQDTIDHLTAYAGAGKAFHTMHLSADHRRLAGLSFDCTDAADELLNHIESLTAKPENISLSVPGGGGWGNNNGGNGARRRKLLQRNKRVELPPKSQISQPCCFQHVSSVDAADRNRYFSLQALVPPGPGGAGSVQQSPHSSIVAPQALMAGGDIS